MFRPMMGSKNIWKSMHPCNILILIYKTEKKTYSSTNKTDWPLLHNVILQPLLVSPTLWVISGWCKYTISNTKPAVANLIHLEGQI
jgi:hypothetical protein